jgi:hypothetical protein
MTVNIVLLNLIFLVRLLAVGLTVAHFHWLRHDIPKMYPFCSFLGQIGGPWEGSRDS